MIPGAVTISYLYPRETVGAFTDCLMRLACNEWARDHIFGVEGGGFVSVSSGPLVASARNEIVESFLDETQGEWLVMIDSDHTFTPEAIRTLVEWGDPVNAPVVGGLCFAGGRGAKIYPTMFHIAKTEDGGISSTPHDLTTTEKGAVVEVDSTGASFLAVHRFLLEDMRRVYQSTAPLIWFGNGYGKGAQIGEDVFFCIRAKNCGAKIFVHTGVEAPHIKTWIIDSTDYATYLQQAVTVGEVAMHAQFVGKVQGIVGALPEPVAEVRLNRAERRRLERLAS